VEATSHAAAALKQQKADLSPEILGDLRQALGRNAVQLLERLRGSPTRRVEKVGLSKYKPALNTY
jgi:hypothetical protein